MDMKKKNTTKWRKMGMDGVKISQSKCTFTLLSKSKSDAILIMSRDKNTDNDLIIMNLGRETMYSLSF